MFQNPFFCWFYKNTPSSKYKNYDLNSNKIGSWDNLVKIWVIHPVYPLYTPGVRIGHVDNIALRLETLPCLGQSSPQPQKSNKTLPAASCRPLIICQS